MKKNLILIITAILFGTQIQAQNKVDTAYIPPSFLGGIAGIDSFISTSGIYPQEAIDQNQEAVIMLNFMIENDGSLSDINCLSKSNILCGEALRILKLMPKWNPAKQNGLTVKVQYKIAIGFRIHKKQIWHILLPENDYSLAPKKETPKKEVEQEEPVMFPEQMPKFIGDVNTYLSTEMIYPEMASANNLQGKVIIQFIVEKDGSISNIEISKKSGWGMDEEAIRLIKNMPNWEPGKQNGKNVRVQYTLPVKFTLK